MDHKGAGSWSASSVGGESCLLLFVLGVWSWAGGCSFRMMLSRFFDASFQASSSEVRCSICCIIDVMIASFWASVSDSDLTSVSRHSVCGADVVGGMGDGVWIVGLREHGGLVGCVRGGIGGGRPGESGIGVCV